MRSESTLSLLHHSLWCILDPHKCHYLTHSPHFPRRGTKSKLFGNKVTRQPCAKEKASLDYVGHIVLIHTVIRIKAGDTLTPRFCSLALLTILISWIEASTTLKSTVFVFIFISNDISPLFSSLSPFLLLLP